MQDLQEESIKDTEWISNLQKKTERKKERKKERERERERETDKPNRIEVSSNTNNKGKN
jgi:hypothetical protein